MIFLNSASSAAALVLYLPGVCTHTDTPVGNREMPESGICLKISEKTQYLMNTLYLLVPQESCVVLSVSEASSTHTNVLQ